VGILEDQIALLKRLCAQARQLTAASDTLCQRLATQVARAEALQNHQESRRKPRRK
jgi:hypothetical protein